MGILVLIGQLQAEYTLAPSGAELQQTASLRLGSETHTVSGTKDQVLYRIPVQQIFTDTSSDKLSQINLCVCKRSQQLHGVSSCTGGHAAETTSGSAGAGRDVLPLQEDANVSCSPLHQNR